MRGKEIGFDFEPIHLIKPTNYAEFNFKHKKKKKQTNSGEGKASDSIENHVCKKPEAWNK